jgi:hypothetical protein
MDGDRRVPGRNPPVGLELGLEPLQVLEARQIEGAVLAVVSVVRIPGTRWRSRPALIWSLGHCRRTVSNLGMRRRQGPRYRHRPGRLRPQGHDEWRLLSHRVSAILATSCGRVVALRDRDSMLSSRPREKLAGVKHTSFSPSCGRQVWEPAFASAVQCRLRRNS